VRSPDEGGANLSEATEAVKDVDCWYPDCDLIVELDGRRTHARLAGFEPDRRRDLVAATNGMQTVRITHKQVTDEPRFVIAAMTALLRNAR